MKDLEQKNKEFFNKIAGYYDKGIFKNLLFNPIKKAVEFVKVKKNSKILDAGCGTGNLLKILEDKNANLKLYGIDISKEMLKIAEKKLKNKAKLNLVAVEKIRYKDKFNYVFSTEAFHHYENQDKAMENFYKALKKNGELIIVDLSFEFALAIIEFTELLESKRRYNMANQLFRSGTSIGANVREAQNAESKADFIHKMKIATKEADETTYWLMLCHHSKNYPNPGKLQEQINTINKILSKIIASSKTRTKALSN